MGDWIKKVDFEKISPDFPCEFEGFLPIKALVESKCAEIPEKPGVYLILTMDTQTPVFNSNYPSFSNCKLPPRTLEQLATRWEPSSPVVYIGKSGGPGNDSNLRKRLSQYFDWFSGKWYKHKGGRDIWQINNPDALIVAWHVTEGEEPRSCERELLELFNSTFGGTKKEKRRPFANRQS